MRTRRIGAVEVGAIGLGGMPMSIEGRPAESRSVAAIHAALDAGVTLIDTADAYHVNADEVGHNESLIARALATYGGDTSDVLVATKGGHLRPGDGSWTVNGTPAYLKQACEASLKECHDVRRRGLRIRLGLDRRDQAFSEFFVGYAEHGAILHAGYGV